MDHVSNAEEVPHCVVNLDHTKRKMTQWVRHLGTKSRYQWNRRQLLVVVTGLMATQDTK